MSFMNTDARVVILADDEKYLRMLAAIPLKRAGFTVVEAEDGKTALELLLQHGAAVQALVTDVCMPGEINGLELAAMARQLLPDIPILVASGTVTPGPDVLPVGGRFLQKPYTLRDLTVEVSILAKRVHAREPAAADAYN